MSKIAFFGHAGQKHTRRWFFCPLNEDVNPKKSVKNSLNANTYTLREV
jgi:hypothetical protein